MCERVAAAGYGFPRAIMKQMKRQRIVASDRSSVSSWGRDRHIRRCIPECGGRRSSRFWGYAHAARSRWAMATETEECVGIRDARRTNRADARNRKRPLHWTDRRRKGHGSATRRPDPQNAPGRWSISFEEQLTTVDTTSTREDPFSAAARRGFAEEFGIPAGTVSICVIAAILETDILNRAIFALIDSDATAKELEHAAQLAITGGSEEIAAVRVIDGSPTSLRTAAQRTDLHATSALRAVLLAGLVGN